MSRPQKGWVSGKEAERRAKAAHRKEDIRRGRRGGGAPAYQETRVGLFARLFRGRR